VTIGDRVLIVDNSSVVRVLLRSALERAGYWVEEAPDTTKARELIEARGYDLVITDLGMPGREGFELLAPARSAGTAVIVLTASLSPDLHARAIQLGAEACLVKHSGVARDVVAAAWRILEVPVAAIHSPEAGKGRPTAAA
jgi:two-component system chemotaxis response regulator CheY